MKRLPAKLPYVPGLATFTPGAVKVDPSGPFAAAPLAQSDVDGAQADIFSYPRGTQIVGHWYANFDGYQGGGTCYWTPEFDAAAITGLRYIWYGGANYFFGYDYTNNRFELMFGGQSMVAAHVAVAGTRISLAWAADSLNTLDGIHYLRISINDAHTYDQATQPTASAVDDPIYIGSDGTNGGLCGIPQAVMFLRRVPYDGAQGINIWGDEIAAQATPADIALTCGSWDTTMFWPTNSSTGALVTGTGQGWSMIHGSNVITALDGFMTRGVAWQNWTAVGTPINSALLDDTEKIFASGGYKFDADAADEGYYFQVDGGLAAGASYMVRVTLHEGGGAQARIRIYDVTNAQQMIFTADFDSAGGHTRTAPWSEIFCFELATIARSGAVADCATFQIQVLEITGGGAGTTVYVHQVEVYANLVDNPSLEVGAGNPWIPTGWTSSGLDAGDTQASSTGGAMIHSGGDAIQFNVSAIGNEAIYQTPLGILGNYYGLGLWMHTQGRLYSSGTRDVFHSTLATIVDLYQSGIPVWEHLSTVARQTHAAASLWSLYGEAAQYYVDDIYMIALDNVSLTVTPANAANSAESGGLRVDGGDDYTQPADYKCKAHEGIIGPVWCTPRHAIANAVAFGQARETIFELYEDANNYLIAYKTTNTVTLAVNARGLGVQTATWNATGLWDALQRALIWAEYEEGGARLFVDGSMVIFLDTFCVFNKDFSESVCWGCDHNGTNQFNGIIEIH